MSLDSLINPPRLKYAIKYRSGGQGPLVGHFAPTKRRALDQVRAEITFQLGSTRRRAVYSYESVGVIYCYTSKGACKKDDAGTEAFATIKLNQED